MARITVKDLKASIKRAADDACASFPADAEMRARVFCAYLSGEISFADPTLADVLNDVAGIAPKKHGEGVAS